MKATSETFIYSNLLYHASHPVVIMEKKAIPGQALRVPEG
jgi:hypothetical protein